MVAIHDRAAPIAGARCSGVVASIRCRHSSTGKSAHQRPVSRPYQTMAPGKPAFQGCRRSVDTGLRKRALGSVLMCGLPPRHMPPRTR
jgi:hypothetical protein